MRTCAALRVVWFIKQYCLETKKDCLKEAKAQHVCPHSPRTLFVRLMKQWIVYICVQHLPMPSEQPQ